MLIIIIKINKITKGYRKFSNIQRQIRKDVKVINNSKKISVKAAKSSFPNMRIPSKYNSMLDKKVHKHYKNAPANIEIEINKEVYI